MSKGILKTQDGLTAETTICCLLDLPRTKVHLIEFKDANAHHLLLRKIKFFSAENVKGSEIKIELAAAKKLFEALGNLTL